MEIQKRLQEEFHLRKEQVENTIKPRRSCRHAQSVSTLSLGLRSAHRVEK